MCGGACGVIFEKHFILEEKKEHMCNENFRENTKILAKVRKFTKMTETLMIWTTRTLGSG
jgi:hypothetical protein